MPLSAMLIESGKIRRTAQGSEVTDSYAVWTEDPIVAFFWAPAHGEPHPILSLCLLEQVEVEPQPTNPIWCKVSLTYVEPFDDSSIEWEDWDFDLTSQTTKITSVPSSDYMLNIPEEEDLGLAIGFDGVDKVDGADVFRGVTTARCSRLWEYLMPDGFWAIEGMRNTLNDTPFIGFERGEVLFLGAQIRRMPDGLIKIEYSFALRKNPGEQTVTLADGTEVTFTMLSPFDHLWYVYQDLEGEDGEANPTATRGIKSIHIAQVYDYMDHNALGLVGPW
ncbi:MAG TPA: hypothetical protein PLD40_07860 [Kiritimatiellia bacterium]|nr:hypothetical protein [Kiritimatiellia bacterium]